MIELSDEDVAEIRRFLLDTCADLKRWLPEPQWRPGWQSEAAQEQVNEEYGPGELFADPEQWIRLTSKLTAGGSGTTR